ncbi:MAG: zf-HC2 domain-containing protein [FCB group bacterium]|nr:zf-HC2 domain-containing protein [FCB group bacterium]
MEHLTEYQLIDYNSGELTYLEKRIVEDHFEACPDCRTRFTELCGDLESITEIFPAEPDNVFWAAYPVRLRERMEKKVTSPAAGYFQQWATALTGVAFSAVMVFMLMVGGSVDKFPQYFDEWAYSSAYSESELYEVDDMDYILAEIMDPVAPDFLPVDEYEITELLDTMSEDEIEALFQVMENVSI